MSWPRGVQDLGLGKDTEWCHCREREEGPHPDQTCGERGHTHKAEGCSDAVTPRLMIRRLRRPVGLPYGLKHGPFPWAQELLLQEPRRPLLPASPSVLSFPGASSAWLIPHKHLSEAVSGGRGA